MDQTYKLAMQSSAS